MDGLKNATASVLDPEFDSVIAALAKYPGPMSAGCLGVATLPLITRFRYRCGIFRISPRSKRLRFEYDRCTG